MSLTSGASCAERGAQRLDRGDHRVHEADCLSHSHSPWSLSLITANAKPAERAARRASESATAGDVIQLADSRPSPRRDSGILTVGARARHAPGAPASAVHATPELTVHPRRFGCSGLRSCCSSCSLGAVRLSPALGDHAEHRCPDPRPTRRPHHPGDARRDHQPAGLPRRAAPEDRRDRRRRASPAASTGCSSSRASTVREGDVVAELDRSALEVQVVQAQAALAAAEARLATLKAGGEGDARAEAEASLRAAKARLARLEAAPRVETIPALAQAARDARQRLAELEGGRSRGRHGGRGPA